ncbi:MAG: hypothetical protein WCJ37_17565, partial [Syntrophus sp. (in: bacteria)]
MIIKIIFDKFIWHLRNWIIFRILGVPIFHDGTVCHLKYPEPLEHLNHPLIDGKTFNFPYIYKGEATLELTSAGKKMWLEIYGELPRDIVLHFGELPGLEDEYDMDSDEFRSMTPEQRLRKMREDIIRYQKEHYGHAIK